MIYLVILVIKDYIRSLKSEDYILNVNETKYINSLVGEYTVSPINIDFAQVFVTDYEKQIPAEDLPRNFSVEGKSYPKLAVIYHLPYTGNVYYLNASKHTHTVVQLKCFLIINILL